MKALLWLLTALLLPLAAVRGDTLAQLQKSFLERYDEANATRDAQLQKLEASYLAALNREIEKTKATGRLEAVIPFVDEVEEVERASGELPALKDNTPPELRQMRGKYSQARTAILKKHAESLISLADKMKSALEAQEAALTKAGKIEDALTAKHMREGLENDAGVRDARAFLQFGTGSGLGRPAMQIRRFGDNLEVVVHYDRSGKISMTSPVSNVRESTEPGRELGDTKATTLGEFVGAKGSQADSRVVYHQVFDGNDMPGAVLSEIEAEYRQEVEEGRGVKLSYKDKAANPHASFGPILPTTNASGSYRITSRYYIPKSNRVLAGFMFVHGSGSAVGGTTLAESGKWVTGEVVSGATHESPDLLFYLSLAPGSKIEDAKGESIVLGELKVEHVAFSAWLVKNFDSLGNPVGEIADPAKQPQVARNGEWIEGE